MRSGSGVALLLGLVLATVNGLAQNTPEEGLPPVQARAAEEPAKVTEKDRRGLLPDLDLGDDLPPMPTPAEAGPAPEPEPSRMAEPVADRPPTSEWTTPPPLVEIKPGTPTRPVGQPVGLPPFRLRAMADSRDWTPVWWMPNKLQVEGSTLGAGGASGDRGVLVPWQPMGWGGYGTVLRARIPVPPLVEEGQGPRKIVYIEQGVVFGKDGQGWLLSASPVRLTLETSQAGEGEGRREIMGLDRGTGVWTLRVPSEGVLVQNWVGAMLHAGRKELGQVLKNEELRQILLRAGEVSWILLPVRDRTG